MVLSENKPKQRSNLQIKERERGREGERERERERGREGGRGGKKN